MDSAQVTRGSAPGVGIAKLTGERRILSREEWADLQSRSQAGWEFISFRRVDPVTGEPDADELREWGFTPGGPTVIPGEMEEAEPGMFRFVNVTAETPDKRQQTNG